jgi:diguanylate cyclase (GGDEF)-like protein
LTRRSTIRILSAAVASVIVLATFAVGLSVLRDRDTALANGVRETRNVATMLGGQIARSIQAIDIVLQHLQAEVEHELNRTDFDGRALLEMPAFHARLQSQLVALPQALHIIVADQYGQVIAASAGWPAPTFNIADRSYFVALRNSHDDRFHVSEPVDNRITGEPALAVARRLQGVAGDFRGIVFISFRSAYIKSIFWSVVPRPGQTFGLTRRDGTLLEMHPSDKARPGQKITNPEPFVAAVGAGGGAYRHVSLFDELPRWSAVHPIADHPLAVFTGIPEHVLLADWRAAALVTAAQTFVLLGVALFLLVTISRQFRRLTSSESSLKATSHKLDTALNNMNQGLAMFDRDARLILCNEHYRTMSGLPARLAEPGAALRDILADVCRRHGRAGDSEAEYARILHMVASGTAWTDDVVFSSHVVAIHNVPMPGGGWVATFDDVTQTRAREARIHHLAHNDALTGIANRSQFLEHLAEAESRLQASGQSFAVLLLDIDHFKRVNDSFGHAAGDALLKEVTRRIGDTLAEGDMLARLGGDEFAVIQAAPRLIPSLAIAHAEMRSGAAALAGRILAAIARPFEVDGHVSAIGASIGIAIAPYDGGAADELMKRADLALYKAKSDGRNIYAFFDPALAAVVEERHRLELDLREALARGEFELHYQPQVDAATRSIRGVEALVRWRHPVDGLMAPDRFIPLAEDTGSIHAIGEWILEAACKEAMGWPDTITVAVNISPVQFRKSNLFEVVADALRRSGLPPQRLEIEITERVLLDADAGNIEVLRSLKELGVSIALDDFGTGYSSLSYLTLFPFDKIKIDRSFIRGLLARDDCAAVIAAIVNLGRSLDIATLAEGIETEAQYEALRAAGVRQMQGFLFGRPAPAGRLSFADDERIASVA